MIIIPKSNWFWGKRSKLEVITLKIMDGKFTAPELTPNDIEIDTFLRPKWLKEFIGQKNVKENLWIFIQSAKKRGEVLDHMLIHGPAGLGKTTLAQIIASELNVKLKNTSGPILERPGDIAAILTALNPGDCLFVDEIHRLNRTVEELLYLAMEDFKLDILIGRGPGARSVRLDLTPFTLIGATTKVGQLSSPLRDRFGLINRLDFYDVDDMKKIVRRSAKIMKIEIDEGGISQIAHRCRGTPRIANRLLRRIRDFAEIQADGVITERLADNSLNALQIDVYGLDSMDRKILEIIIDKFDGGPVGINTLTAAISEHSETIEDVYEPYLIQMGFINRTPRGRKVTSLAYQHLNRK